MGRSFFIGALILIVNLLHAQEKAPLLKGKVVLSVKQGTMDCDLVLSDIPAVKDYYIQINTGMNLRYIRNFENDYNYNYDKSYYDTISGESFLYSIPDNTGRAKVVRSAYRFSYCGKFPVIGDTLTASDAGDWKGNIAFNGYSVRADGRQTGWYPVLYDIKNDKSYHDVRYDITVECSDCSVIYVNGSDPVQGKTAHLKSDEPKEMMLFAGDYKFEQVDGTNFLNPSVSTEQLKQFSKMTSDFKKFYEKKLGIPYKSTITYANTTPISKNNAWMFVSYPTIVTIGRGDYDMKSFFSKEQGDWFRPFMAHELGHYYFGHYKHFNSELGDLMGEAFSEYLSMKATAAFYTDSMYKAKTQEKIENLKDMQPIPFGKIKSNSDYKDRELYVYHYGPLVLMAIEKEIGQEKMWAWLHTILVLQVESEFTDYNFLERTLAVTLKNDRQLQAIKERYFMSDSSLANAKEKLK
jgi:hypothetical protein